MESVQVDKLRREFLSLSNERAIIEDRIKIQRILKSSIQKEMSYISQQLVNFRWCSALELFVMMKIEVDENIVKTFQANIEKYRGKQKKIKLSGCSTILGLPLMNNGVFDGETQIFVLPST